MAQQGKRELRLYCEDIECGPWVDVLGAAVFSMNRLKGQHVLECLAASEKNPLMRHWVASIAGDFPSRRIVDVLAVGVCDADRGVRARAFRCVFRVYGNVLLQDPSLICLLGIDGLEMNESGQLSDDAYWQMAGFDVERRKKYRDTIKDCVDQNEPYIHKSVNTNQWYLCSQAKIDGTPIYPRGTLGVIPREKLQAWKEEQEVDKKLFEEWKPKWEQTYRQIGVAEDTPGK
jgi:hypothetical protein